MPDPRITVGPGAAPDWVAAAVTDGGGEIVGPADAEAVVWLSPIDTDGLRAVLEAGAGVRWVQLPWAGVESYAAVGMFADYADRAWTCGKGVYAEPVAEHALALGLAGLRMLPTRVAARGWGRSGGRSLYDGRVTIVGGGGITASLLELLAPFRVEATVVRRQPEPLAGAARTTGPDGLEDALGGADLVVLALALTPETTGLIGRRQLECMDDHAWLVNVARGAHVVTDDLVDALRRGTIGGAALDVTDPEPLPDGHPLWDLPNCIITPHTANTPEMARAPLAARIRENVRRFARGEPLVGPVDATAGY